MYTKGIVSVHSVLFGFVLFKKKSRFSKIKIKREGKKLSGALRHRSGWHGDGLWRHGIVQATQQTAETCRTRFSHRQKTPRTLWWLLSFIIKVDADFETVVHELRTYFGFFKMTHTCESILRFYSYNGVRSGHVFRLYSQLWKTCPLWNSFQNYFNYFETNFGLDLVMNTHKRDLTWFWLPMD